MSSFDRLRMSSFDAANGDPVAILGGHTGAVRAVAVSADGRTVVSGGLDGTIKLWDSRSFALLRTLRPDRRFECADITGLTGVTPAQRQALLSLGAIDRS
jgi:WD40 repeat protein